VSPKFFLLRNTFPHHVAIQASRERRPCRWLAVAYHARHRHDFRRLVWLLVESIVQNRDRSGKQSQILYRSPTMQAVVPAPRNGSRSPRSSPATPSAASCTARCARPPRHPRTWVAQREIFSIIKTARGNNHRSCIAAPLCKLSCQPLGTDHEAPDQAQPRPRQPPVPRAVRGHQDTREPGSRSEKFSAESRPLGETITDPVSQPHYASCLASPLERITKPQIKPGHALGSPL